MTWRAFLLKKTPAGPGCLGAKWQAPASPHCLPPATGERIIEWSSVLKYYTALVFSIFILRDIVKSNILAKWSGQWGRLWKCAFCLFHELCVSCAARLQNFASHMKERFEGTKKMQTDPCWIIRPRSAQEISVSAQPIATLLAEPWHVIQILQTKRLGTLDK